MTRMLEISTAAGPGAFVVRRFTGREELGRPYEYRLELLSEHADITPEQILGTNATVQLRTGDGSEPRWFNGYVTRFSIQGQVRTPAFRGELGFLYLVTLSPGLWFLGRTMDCRIARDVRLGDLVATRLEESGLFEVESTLGETERRDYVVQYRESDLDFVSRLMEHAGIYYCFAHANGKHTVRLLDSASKHPADPALATLRPNDLEGGEGTLGSLELVAQVHAGSFATGDHAYAHTARLAAVSDCSRSHANAGFEVFDHPVGSTLPGDVARYAQVRAQELACRHVVAHGRATERRLQVGYRVKVAGHDVPALNGDYVVTAHDFVATNDLSASGLDDGSSFTCEFRSIPASVQFRSSRVTPRPVIGGTQSARVVSDFRTDTDVDVSIGRVKVQFHWERYGESSCWARVSTPWAGRGYGFQNMPRVGEEVLVQFVDGDPDRPVVVGRVHNIDNAPPFKLPAGAALTGLKTLSIDADGKSVAGRWNELRFDDTDGREQVYLQAQNDLDTRVLHDARISVGNERHLCVTGDAFEKYGADHHALTAGDHNEKVGGSLSFDVGDSVHVKSGSKFLVDGGQEVHLKGALKVVLESTSQLSLKVGDNFIDINPGGIFIKGSMVMVNSGGSAGSGSGAAPIAGKAAREATTSTGGSPIDTPRAPVAPIAFSPRASNFLAAAGSAAPFVAAGCQA